MRVILKYWTTALFILTVSTAFAQQFKSEEERLTHANNLFDDGKFIEAEPHMLHFLSLNQTSAEFNFKYGVCVLHNDEDKTKSLRYLRYASKQSGTDTRVFFYLGKAFHLNYLFSDAVTEYKKFQQKGDDKWKKRLHVDQHIVMCNNGKKLLKELTELVVDDKKESSYDRFQYSYDLSDIGGKILVTEEFQSKYDKKVGYRSLVYFPPLQQNVIFYSSYGKSGDNGLDLYKVRRLPNGNWSDPEILPPHINTPYDDAYGFLHFDGTTFYFCSKGHSSMGGYDVFKCSYNMQTNSFGPPVNLDYKVNTPDDDIMYVVDSLNNNAYFASNRRAKGGYLDVYKVRVEVFPLVNVILAGDFMNEINPADNKATIKVENSVTGEMIGVYNPNEQGKYVLILPKAGKYKLIVETPQSEKIHSGLIDIPPQKEMKPLKQEILLVNRNGKEQLIIRNLFDQEVENSEAIFAEVMSKLSDPEINSDQFPDSLFAVDKDAVIDQAIDDGHINPDDLETMINDMVIETQEEADEINNKMNAAYSVADTKSKEAAAEAKKAEEILSGLDNITDPEERKKKIEEANQHHKNSKDLNTQATTAINLANSLKVEHEDKQKEADESKQIATAFQDALSQTDHEAALAKLKDLQTQINDIITTDSSDIQKRTAYDDLLVEAAAKQKLADDALAEAQEYREGQDEINNRLSRLKDQHARAKKKDKESLQLQIDDLEEQKKRGR